MKVYDLIVIGAGPAGAAAAITAARRGARVLVTDRGKFPRQKVCGEFVSAESLGLLENLLDPSRRPLLRNSVRIERTRVFLDDRILTAAVRPGAASIARFDLDEALVASAVASGVEVLQQVTVQKVAGTGPFTVQTSAGEFVAKAVVNASGRWSNLHSAPAPNGPPKWLGLKAHFAEMSPPASVDLYFFDGGYCGVQPVNLDGDAAGGRVNACAMVRADAASSLSEVFRLQPALEERSRSWKALSEPVGTSPLLFRPPEPVRDGVLMAGDAACFVDPFVGDGISLALRSGALAADCVLRFFRGENEISDAARAYRDEYLRRFGRVFQNSSKIRRLLQIPRALRRPAVAVLANTPAITEYLVRKTR